MCGPSGNRNSISNNVNNSTGSCIANIRSILTRAIGSTREDTGALGITRYLSPFEPAPLRILKDFIVCARLLLAHHMVNSSKNILEWRG